MHGPAGLNTGPPDPPDTLSTAVWLLFRGSLNQAENHRVLGACGGPLRQTQHHKVLNACCGSLDRKKNQWVLVAWSGSLGRIKHHEDPLAVLSNLGSFMLVKVQVPWAMIRILVILSTQGLLVFVVDPWTSAPKRLFVLVEDPWAKLSTMRCSVLCIGSHTENHSVRRACW